MSKIILSLIIFSSLVACGPNNKKADGFTPGAHGIFTGGGLDSGMTGNPNIPSDGGDDTLTPTKNGAEDTGGTIPEGSTLKYVESILLNTTQIQKDLEEILSNLDPEAPFLKQDKSFVNVWNIRFKDSKLQLSNVLKRLDIKKVCTDRYGNNKTASVKKFNLDSNVCISTNDLTKISSEVLRRQIYSILLHEISHLLGFLETDAKRMQSIISMNYEYLLRNASQSSQIRQSLLEIASLTTQLIESIANRPDKDFSKENHIMDRDKLISYANNLRFALSILTSSLQTYISVLEYESQNPADHRLKEASKFKEDLVAISRPLLLLPIQVYDSKNYNSYLYNREDFLLVKAKFQTALKLFKNAKFIQQENEYLKWLSYHQDEMEEPKED